MIQQSSHDITPTYVLGRLSKSCIERKTNKSFFKRKLDIHLQKNEIEFLTVILYKKQSKCIKELKVILETQKSM